MGGDSSPGGSRHRIPDGNVAVLATAHQRAAIRNEPDDPGRTDMCVDRAHDPSAGDVPDRDPSVAGGDRKLVTVRVEVERVDLVPDHQVRLAALTTGIPEVDVSVVGPRREEPPFGMERRGDHVPLEVRPAAQTGIAGVDLPERPERVSGARVGEVLLPDQVLGGIHLVGLRQYAAALDISHPELDGEPFRLHRGDDPERRQETDEDGGHEHGRAVAAQRLAQDVEGRATVIFKTPLSAKRNEIWVQESI